MNIVEPALHEGAMLVVFAKDQPQYQQLPASVDQNGTVMTEWEPTAEELTKLLDGGRIRLWLLHTGIAEEKSCHICGPRKLTPIIVEAIDNV